MRHSIGCPTVLLLALGTVVVAVTNPTYTIVETIPEDVKLYSANHTYETFMYLFESARTSIDIAMLYIRLSDGSEFPDHQGWHGPNLMNALRDAHNKRNVTIRMAQSVPTHDYPDTDSAILAAEGVAQVRNLDMEQLTGSPGVLHTKLIIVDGKKVYLGSANMDWTSTAQVKELGVVIENEPVLLGDAQKCFDQYWLAGGLPGKLPPSWSSEYHTKYNFKNPYQAVLNGRDVDVYLAAAPPAFVAPDRFWDADSIVANIMEADQFVNIEVMDYLPTSLYKNPNVYWDTIDRALRQKAFNDNTTVRVMIGCWQHSANIMWQWLDSLNDVENIEVRLFVVPPLNVTIPFTRVNHAKYMVTDKSAFIGTSNWSSDYFTDTGGLSFTFRGGDVQGDLAGRFFRDWDSQYSFPLAGRC